jgi:hypothetical protein
MMLEQLTRWVCWFMIAMVFVELLAVLSGVVRGS